MIASRTTCQALLICAKYFTPKRVVFPGTTEDWLKSLVARLRTNNERSRDSLRGMRPENLRQMPPDNEDVLELL
jgi:hypothetical protein